MTNPDQSATTAGEPAVPQEVGQWPDVMRTRSVATLPEHVQQGIELTRQHTVVASEIANLQWGKGMTPAIRRAITSYCERWGIDANTELDVLGGSFYINSEFYLRKLGELRRAGVIADFWFEHIHNDPRYKLLMDDTALPQSVRDEATRRFSDAMFKRIEQNAPENATAVCVCYISLPSGGHPVKGCKWAGGGTSVKQPRQGGSAAPNPIAESNAELSVESQSARRAARQIISHVSDKNVPNFEQMEHELEDLSTSFSAALEMPDRVNRELEAGHHAPRALATSGVDAYESAARDGEPVAVFRPGKETLLSPEQIAQTAARAERDDPYADDPPPAAAATPAPVTPPPAPAPPVHRAPVKVVCHECGNDIVVGEPSTHKGSCSKYAD